jgi:hypothetical protein
MAQSNNILEELRELNSQLAGQPVEQVYSVPPGYFDNLAENVLSRIRTLNASSVSEELEILSPLLSKANKEMPFAIPSNYFESLDHSIAIIATNKEDSPKEELESISPLLNSIGKQNVYSVPWGYFEQINSAPETKVVSIKRRSWIRYAIAASITALVFLAGFMFVNRPDKAGRVLVRLERDVKKMDDTQKDKLIEFIDAGFDGKETVQNNPVKSNEVKDLLKGVSEQELKDFEEQFEDIEDVLMTN